MKILLIPSNYKPFFNGGGETYLHAVATALRDRGHEVKAIVNFPDHYEFEGIECFPQGEVREMWTAHNNLIRWCDIVVTQLLGTAYAYNKAHQHEKPILFFAHNGSRSYPINIGSNIFVVYNSESLKKAVNFPHPDFVLPPPIDYRKFSQAPIKQRKCVTIINCNENKGGQVLIDLAQRMPDIQFLGVEGYGEQIKANSPNLKYVRNSPDVREHLSVTRVLIMPSREETYGQAATEAMCCGIPVLASPTPGLKENLGTAGIFIARKNVDLYEETIRLLFENEDYYTLQAQASVRRSRELDPTANLDRLSQWLLKIKR